MKYTAGEVHFYDDGSASCLLRTEASPEEAFMYEAWFWACFANWQFNNTGGNVKLAEKLLRMAAGIPDDQSIYDIGSFEWELLLGGA